jgi:hypothetical protein
LNVSIVEEAVCHEADAAGAVNPLAQEAVIVGLARRMKEHGSWTGETHIQKMAYLLRELMEVPFTFDFILYKHGPFSFELRDELSIMHTDRLIERETQSRHGSRIAVTERGLEIERRFQRTMARYEGHLEWITSRLGNRGVEGLEGLALALWVTRQMDEHSSAEERAAAVIELQPHLSAGAATESVEQIDELIGEAAPIAYV